MADIRINSLSTTAASTASDDFVAVDGSANGTRKLNAYSPTFGGNLTVSGTGTSTFAGNVTLNASGATLSVINANGLSSVLVGQSASSGQAIRLGNSRTLNYGDAMVSRNLRAVSGADTYQTEFTGGYGAMEFGYDGANSIATRWIVSNSAQTANTAFTPSYAMTLKGNGRLLLGTTVDSGALLQVGTNTTTSAGGMVFGTDTNLYRTGAGSIAINSTLLAELALVRGSTVEAKVYSDSTGSLKVQTSGTLALTLDSSQNATFAGTVQLNSDNGLYIKQGNIARWTSTGLSSGTARADMYADSGGSLYIRTNGVTTALTLDSSQNATFAGTVTLAANKTLTVGTTASTASTISVLGDRPVSLVGTYGRVETSGGVGGWDAVGLLYKGSAGTAGAAWYAAGSNDTVSSVYLGFGSTPGSNKVISATSTAVSISVPVSLGNTVNTVSPTSPNRTITMVIGGTTYYIHAKTTND